VLEYAVGTSTTWTIIDTYNTATYYSWTKCRRQFHRKAGSILPCVPLAGDESQRQGYDHWALDNVQIVATPLDDLQVTSSAGLNRFRLRRGPVRTGQPGLLSDEQQLPRHSIGRNGYAELAGRLAAGQHHARTWRGLLMLRFRSTRPQRLRPVPTVATGFTNLTQRGPPIAGCATGGFGQRVL